MPLPLTHVPLALLLALSPVVTAPPNDPAPSDPADPAAMDAYVQERMAATNTPGLAYAVVGPGGVEHRGTFGVDGDGAPVDEHTPFLWGSVAKPVTATAALVLAGEGRLDLDAPVEEYLPVFAEFGADPTVRDLLTQTSGLTGRTAAATSDLYGERAPDLDARVARVAASEPGTPGTHEYSSANYLVLGAVMEEVTGDFRGYLRESVLEPTGMDGVFASAAQAREAGLSPGHRTLWGVPVADADGVDDEGAAYGYLGGDVTDLAAFARAQVAAKPPVLDAAALEEARTGLVPVPGSAQEYGLGWRDTALSDLGEPIVFHGGSTPGYAAIVVVLPERGRAVVVLQNTYDMLRDNGIQAVAFGLAHMVAGGDSPSSPGTDPLYLASVWTPTAAAAALGAGAVAAVRVRRPRRWASALWSALGLVSVAAAVGVAASHGPRPALTWLPDVTAATLAAGALGAAVVVLRLLAHRRGDRART
ncbi:serine hydrolase [Nocardiopsis sp. CNS-639]|uniref:serine hydrolase domain-containing protein n=1 Tax=Nocardiopsis sp. CNS-639 TaxID=1169153 RepID=UPI00037D3CF5|nr:serine hydrolase domain-containing protein [Nocardiopsis sp. CNS-639]